MKKLFDGLHFWITTYDKNQREKAASRLSIAFLERHFSSLAILQQKSNDFGLWTDMDILFLRASFSAYASTVISQCIRPEFRPISGGCPASYFKPWHNTTQHKNVGRCNEVVKHDIQRRKNRSTTNLSRSIPKSLGTRSVSLSLSRFHTASLPMATPISFTPISAPHIQ